MAEGVVFGCCGAVCRPIAAGYFLGQQVFRGKQYHGSKVCVAAFATQHGCIASGSGWLFLLESPSRRSAADITTPIVPRASHRILPRQPRANAGCILRNYLLCTVVCTYAQSLRLTRAARIRLRREKCQGIKSSYGAERDQQLRSR